jgi:hypothetical protein
LPCQRIEHVTPIASKVLEKHCCVYDTDKVKSRQGLCVRSFIPHNIDLAVSIHILIVGLTESTVCIVPANESQK